MLVIAALGVILAIPLGVVVDDKTAGCDENSPPLLPVLPAADEDSDDPAIDRITKSSVVDQIPLHLKDESKSPMLRAISPDGRTEMKPAKSAIGDADCDSPQIGEEEPWPSQGGVVNMNNVTSAVPMEEQREEREVLLDAAKNITQDDPSAYSGPPLDHPSEFVRPAEINPAMRMEVLPLPNDVVEKKSKCSRTNNGNDIPEALHALDDECGMPEPEIPCETAGNSTLCVQRIQLPIPPVPKVELMPAIPPQPYMLKVPQYVDVAVEFVDFGIAREIRSHVSNSVGRVIEEAGDEFAVDQWAVQLVRSGGADVATETLIHDLPDRAQLIVYLKCAYERFRSSLIAKLPACEDLMTEHYTVIIEIPAFHAVYVVSVVSTESVMAAIIRAPVNIRHVDKVTFDGAEVSLDTPLNKISFRNNSALIVYPDEPCPTQSTSPSNSPTPLPSPSTTPSVSNCPEPPLPKKHKVRKLGAYDAFRHCKNARGEKLQLPDPASLGLDPEAVDPLGKADNPDVDCEMSEMTPEEVEDFSNVGAVREDQPGPEPNNTLVRQPMTKTAVITVKYAGRSFPVQIKPVAQGVDIFDAVQQVSGKDHTGMMATFLDRIIDHYTPLKPFGFVDGDVVEVKDFERLPHASV